MNDSIDAFVETPLYDTYTLLVETYTREPPLNSSHALSRGGLLI